MEIVVLCVHMITAYFTMFSRCYPSWYSLLCLYILPGLNGMAKPTCTVLHGAELTVITFRLRVENLADS